MYPIRGVINAESLEIYHHESVYHDAIWVDDSIAPREPGVLGPKRAEFLHFHEAKFGPIHLIEF